MPFPPEFDFQDEADFVQGLLNPLLRRLGFAIVVDYHGPDEFGKDLVFGGIDAFGHVRYHALQAKYVAVIRQGDAKRLSDACEQAFTIPFTHPQTGQKEFISTFYVANGGTISNNARKLFFAQVLPKYGQNACLLDGKALLDLHSWSGIARSDTMRRRVTGLVNELKINDIIISVEEPMLEQLADGVQGQILLRYVLTRACEQYMAEPFITGKANLVTTYYILATEANSCFTDLHSQMPDGVKASIAKRMLKLMPVLVRHGSAIRHLLASFMEELGPFAPPEPVYPFGRGQTD